ncbi:MAG TPA: hypothetical protein VGM30_10615 [Puia sp.]|jgi:hypothetical protein
MPTPVLNNGLFLRDVELRAGSHLDSYHLMNMLGDAEPTDMGPIDLWVMAQKVEMPLYQLSSFNGKNIQYVDNAKGEWKWQIPITDELPYVVEDIEPSNITKGIDGHEFRIKYNKKVFGHGEVITYDKMNGIQLYITDEDILPVGDGYLYTVRIRNNDSFKFLDNQFLNNKTRWFRLTSSIGEYGQRYADLTVEAGYREFYNFVGNESAHFEYSISSKAELMLRGGVRATGALAVNEIWNVHDKTVLDPSITRIEQLAAKMGKDWMKTALSEGKLSRSFVTKLESAGLSKITQDIENDLMWGQGGAIQTQGPEILRASVGLWKQLDNSYKHIYNMASFNLDMFESEINNFYYGKVDLVGPDPKRQIIVQTGRAGMKMVNEAIAKKALSQNLTTQSTEIGAIKMNPSNMSLHYGFSFTSFTIPFIANVQFVYNPALDPVNANEIENPIINGYRLSSYSFIIFDITDEGNDNIKLLRKSWDNELRWWYINGKFDYQGRTSGFQSSGGNFGYKVQMEKPKDALWVKDPTKVLKIVMRNPITGGSL